MMPSLMRLSLLSFLFFLSGMCGLSYEIIWSYWFGIGLGHETPGVLAVLTAFFAGIAIGSATLDGPLSRSRNPARWYAMLELAGGLWALLTVKLLPEVNDWAHLLLGPAPSAWIHWSKAFLVPLIVLLPTTFAIGGALPAIERWLTPWSHQGRTVGVLYSSSTLGAFFGAFIATFLVVPVRGLEFALSLFAVINIGCGIIAFLLSLSPAAEWPSALTPWLSTNRKRLYLTVLFTGLLGIGYEVVAIWVLGNVLEDTVYTFSILLMVYLVATSTGAGLYQRFGTRVDDESLLRLFICGLSFSVLIGTLIMAESQHIYQNLRPDWIPGMPIGMAAEMLLGVLVLFLPALLMGGLFSHLVHLARGPRGGIGTAVALNTLGSMAAPFIFGVLIIPMAGIRWAVATIVTGYLLLLPRPRFQVAVSGLVLLAVMIVVPERIPRPLHLPETRLVDYREGVMGEVSVIEYADGNRALLMNQHFVMGGTAAARAERRQAHIPLLLHPEPRQALFLGVGTGITLGASRFYPDLTATGVELVPEILDLLSYFQEANGGLQEHQRIQLVRSDARRFIRSVPRKYDVIVGDLFHPSRDGAGGLYTVEHFAAVRDRLAPEGLYCQWLSLFQMERETLEIIVASFLEVFPESGAFFLRPSLDAPVVGLVGWAGSKGRYSRDWMKVRVRDISLRQELEDVGLATELELFGSFLADCFDLAELSAGAALNRDTNPVVSFTAPYFVYRPDSNLRGPLFWLTENYTPGYSFLFDNGISDRAFLDGLTAYGEARRLYLRGLSAEERGNQGLAADLYLQSLQTSADFNTAYARALLLASFLASQNPEEARRLLESLTEQFPHRPAARHLLESLAEQP